MQWKKTKSFFLKSKVKVNSCFKVKVQEDILIVVKSFRDASDIDKTNSRVILSFILQTFAVVLSVLACASAGFLPAENLLPPPSEGYSYPAPGKIQFSSKTIANLSTFQTLMDWVLFWNHFLEKFEENKKMIKKSVNTKTEKGRPVEVW